MMGIYQIIKRPLITEKSGLLKEKQNQVMFEVDRHANKKLIREAVEKLFKVKVLSVRTSTVTGKVKRMGKGWGRRSDWKRAIVTLKEGSRIEFFEGV